MYQSQQQIHYQSFYNILNLKPQTLTEAEASVSVSSPNAFPCEAALVLARVLVLVGVVDGYRSCNRNDNLLDPADMGVAAGHQIGDLALDQALIEMTLPELVLKLVDAETFWSPQGQSWKCVQEWWLSI